MAGAARRYPAPIFLGFCLKRFVPASAGWSEMWAADWTRAVHEVCSASECIAERPPAWVERWDFNRASCWNTEAAALACVPAAERDTYRLYAYRAIPLVFDSSGRPTELPPAELFTPNLPALPPEPGLPGYVRLGYDVVEYAGYLNYGCSPLSCNGMGAQHAVNQYCLLDAVDAAYDAAVAFGVDEPEPGPYIIFEVLRRAGLAGGA